MADVFDYRLGLGKGTLRCSVHTPRWTGDDHCIVNPDLRQVGDLPPQLWVIDGAGDIVPCKPSDLKAIYPQTKDPRRGMYTDSVKSLRKAALKLLKAESKWRDVIEHYREEGRWRLGTSSKAKKLIRGNARLSIAAVARLVNESL